MQRLVTFLLKATLIPLLLLGKSLVIGAALLPAVLLVQWAWAQAWWLGVLSVGVGYFVFGFGLCLGALVVKWGSFYRAREGDWPFVHAQTIRWALTAQFHDLARMLFLHQIRGTWLINMYFRMLGARIGRDVILNCTAISDWDLIEIGDDTMVGDDATILAHVGEKGRLRMSPVRIGRGCTISRDTVIMPGSVIGDGAVLAAMTAMPKDKELPPKTIWGGTRLHQLNSRDARTDDEANANRSAGA